MTSSNQSVFHARRTGLLFTHRKATTFLSHNLNGIIIMKNVKIFAVAATLSLISFGSFAAEQVTQPADGAQKIGVISVAGPTTLGGLESKLAAQAADAGASSYRILSVTGNNRMHADAEIYK
jgi:multiple stress resistance protein BhsA